jgi:tetratricopeptide (TPR) repeat protein
MRFFTHCFPFNSPSLPVPSFLPSFSFCFLHPARPNLQNPGTGGAGNANKTVKVADVRLNVDSMQLPSGIKGAVVAHFDALPPTVRDVLMVASVLGRRFILDLLETVYDGDKDQVRNGVDVCRKQGLLNQLEDKTMATAAAPVAVESNGNGVSFYSNALFTSTRQFENMSSMGTDLMMHSVGSQEHIIGTGKYAPKIAPAHFMFSHAMIQDVVYNMIPIERRQMLHRTIAEEYLRSASVSRSASENRSTTMNSFASTSTRDCTIGTRDMNGHGSPKGRSSLSSSNSLGANNSSSASEVTVAPTVSAADAEESSSVSAGSGAKAVFPPSRNLKRLVHLIAHHYSFSDDYFSAIKYVSKAGKEALSESAMPEAVRWYSTLFTILEQVDLSIMHPLTMRKPMGESIFGGESMFMPLRRQSLEDPGTLVEHLSLSESNRHLGSDKGSDTNLPALEVLEKSRVPLRPSPSKFVQNVRSVDDLPVSSRDLMVSSRKDKHPTLLRLRKGSQDSIGSMESVGISTSWDELSMDSQELNGEVYDNYLTSGLKHFGYSDEKRARWCQNASIAYFWCGHFKESKQYGRRALEIWEFPEPAPEAMSRNARFEYLQTQFPQMQQVLIRKIPPAKLTNVINLYQHLIEIYFFDMDLPAMNYASNRCLNLSRVILQRQDLYDGRTTTDSDTVPMRNKSGSIGEMSLDSVSQCDSIPIEELMANRSGNKQKAVAQAHAWAALGAGAVGHIGVGLANLKKAEQIADTLKDAKLSGFVKTYGSYGLAGHPKHHDLFFEMAGEVQSTAELAEHMSDSFGSARSYIFAASLHKIHGRWREVSDQVKLAWNNVYLKTRDRFTLICVWAFRALKRMAVGHFEKAMEYLLKAEQVALNPKAPVSIEILLKGMRAWLTLHQEGDVEKALAIAEEAKVLIQQPRSSGFFIILAFEGYWLLEDTYLTAWELSIAMKAKRKGKSLGTRLRAHMSSHGSSSYASASSAEALSISDSDISTDLSENFGISEMDLVDNMHENGRPQPIEVGDENSAPNSRSSFTSSSSTVNEFVRPPSLSTESMLSEVVPPALLSPPRFAIRPQRQHTIDDSMMTTPTPAAAAATAVKPSQSRLELVGKNWNDHKRREFSAKAAGLKRDAKWGYKLIKKWAKTHPFALGRGRILKGRYCYINGEEKKALKTWKKAMVSAKEAKNDNDLACAMYCFGMATQTNFENQPDALVQGRAMIAQARVICHRLECKCHYHLTVWPKATMFGRMVGIRATAGSCRSLGSEENFVTPNRNDQASKDMFTDAVDSRANLMAGMSTGLAPQRFCSSESQDLRRTGSTLGSVAIDFALLSEPASLLDATRPTENPATAQVNQ